MSRLLSENDEIVEVKPTRQIHPGMTSAVDFLGCSHVIPSTRNQNTVYFFSTQLEYMNKEFFYRH